MAVRHPIVVDDSETQETNGNGAAIWEEQGMRLDHDELRSEQQRLVAYALFNSVLWDTNEDALQGTHRALFPLLVTALKRTQGTRVTMDEVGDRLEALFGLRFPNGVLKGMLGTAQRRRLLTRETVEGVVHLTVDRQALRGLADTKHLASDLRRDHGRFISELRQFGEARFDIEMTEQDAESALHKLLLARIDRISTIHDYSDVGSEWSSNLRPGDAGYILGRFIEEMVLPGTVLHDYFSRIARGSALAVAVFYRGNQVRRLASSMNGLRVFFDTPLLLSLLGYHKPEDKTAAEDVLRLVKDSGARPCVFEHTRIEVRNVLLGTVLDMKEAEHGQALESTMPVVETYFEQALDSDDPMPGRDRYVIAAARLPETLRRHGFRIVERQLAAQPGEDVERLSAILRRRYGGDPSSRLIEFDVDSLLGVHRRRASRRPASLDEARAVFVTTNPELARAADEYFDQASNRNRIPVCYTSDELANLLWLKHPLDLPDMPWRQVISYVHASLYPGEELWAKYRAAVEALRRRPDPITDSDYYLLRFSVDARQALMDGTLGHAERLTAPSVSDILKQAKSSLTGELRAEFDTKVEALESTQQRLAETEDRLTAADGERVEALRKLREFEEHEPLSRIEVVWNTVNVRSRGRARWERRGLVGLMGVSFVASICVTTAALFGVGVPLMAGLAYVLLNGVISIFGFRSVDHGWTFARFERDRAEQLTDREVGRILASVDEAQEDTDPEETDPNSGG